MSALLAYLFGMASMLVSDILVSKFLGDADIALWADVRALFGILAAFVTLGLEMVIIRAPGASRLLLRLVIVQAVVLSLPLGFLVHQLGYLSSPWSAILLASGAAFSLAQGQYFRSHSSFFVSQFAQQGWKIIVLILLADFIFLHHLRALPIDLVASSAVFVVSILGWGLVLTRRHDGDSVEHGLRKHYAISFRFLVTNIILNVALFGEQMIVNGLGTNAQAAIYFTHMTYFLLPASILTTFVGFRIGPWVRDNPDDFEAMLARRRLSIHMVIVATVALAQAIGWIGWWLIGPSVGEPNAVLQIAFFISATLRTYYVMPSAYNGIFGAPTEHDLLIISQLFLLLVLAAGIYAFFPAVDIILVVAIAGVFNWMARTLISDRVMKFIMKRRQVQAHQRAKE